MTDSLSHRTAPLTSVDLSATRLVNKEYYDAIDAKMAKLPQPTVADAAEAMCAQGNEPYFNVFRYLYKDAIQKPFSSSYVRHEISHIAARLGHTPQMELVGLAFEFGFSIGSDARHFSQAEAISKKSRLFQSEQKYMMNAVRYTDRALEPLSRRDWAIYVAAGMYLRDKFDHLRHGYAWGASYADQLEFCERYADTDASPIALNEMHRVLGHRRDYGEMFNEAPYALLKISDAEWRAIEGVALGMTKPDQTKYPKRLAAVKEALVHLGVDYNVCEKLKAKEAAMNIE